MRFKLFSPLIALLCATTFVACGTSPDVAGPDSSGAVHDTMPSGDRPLTIAEALKTTEPGPASVSGFLVTTDSGVVLAESLLESYPPQAGGKTLPVVGLDPASYEMETANGVSWTNSPVEVPGTVDNGALYVDRDDV